MCDELLDKLRMVQKALQWLAVDKYEPILRYYLHLHFEILLICAHVLAGRDQENGTRGKTGSIELVVF